MWFWAASLTVTDKRGISALLLRRAMVNVAREPWHGDVEIDDTWVGGPQAGLRGSRPLTGRKAARVVVAVERRDRVSGRVRMAVVPDVTQTTMVAGVKHVPRTQPVRSDLRKGVPAVVPLADRAIGNLQGWPIGTYHGVSNSNVLIQAPAASGRSPAIRG